MKFCCDAGYGSALAFLTPCGLTATCPGAGPPPPSAESTLDWKPCCWPPSTSCPRDICAISESVYDTNWKSYNLPQPKGSLPVGPLAIAVHLASVWVPFTSEAKEAVAHYDELLEEMKHALRECGRKLAAHVRARAHADREMKRRSLFEKYIPEVAMAIGAILGLEKDKIEKPFYKTLPVFVKFADEEPAPAEAKAAATPSVPPPAESEPPPAAVAKAGKAGKRDKADKGKGKGKGKQLSLLE